MPAWADRVRWRLRMAIDDCLAAECKGMKIELVSADNQNKADVGAAARVNGSTATA